MALILRTPALQAYSTLRNTRSSVPSTISRPDSRPVPYRGALVAEEIMEWMVPVGSDN
jgi:hypothetical protein